MFLGNLKLLLLTFLSYVSYTVSENNYLLDKECSLNTENTLLECFLTFNSSLISPEHTIETNLIPGLESKSKVVPESKLIKNLKFEARNLERDITHFKIYDSAQKRYEIPRNTLEYFEKNKPFFNFTQKNLANLQTLKPNTTFKLDYLSDSGKDALFGFAEDFLFLNDFLSFSLTLNSSQIFGFGERSSDFKLKPGLYTSWPRDNPNSFDDGKGAKNSYGNQPFLLARLGKSSYIAVAFLNSNAQDLQISEKNKDGKTKINFISIGGIVELLVLNAASPQELLQKYHSVIGRPVLPAFWALGWHQSRWGYRNTSHLDTIVQKYNENKIPIDTIWSDIDYMNNFEDFGFDQVNFAGLPEFVKNMHQIGVHYVPIIDMGIPFRSENYYYKLGKDLDIYIKSNYTKTDLLNKVWPGVCVFPDFTNYQKAKVFWYQGLSILNYLLDFDGIWLDMNEPAGFIKGEIFEGGKSSENNLYSDLTYMPGLGRDGYDIDSSSLSVNALMSTENAPFNTVYNLKPLNVFYQNKITNEYFGLKGQRPFVLSRSSFIGMGRYTSHWLGDNMSFFGNMTASIAGVFNFQMFGFNLVGADICGLMYDASDELCARWTALGAFYPFSRNHNNYTSVDQEPYNLGEKTLNTAKKAIRTKYALLRYFYTQLYFSSLQGGAFFQPLGFQFPSIDEFFNSDKILNEQVMLGPAILFNPILTKEESNITFAFPNENWNRFPNGELVLKKNQTEKMQKENFDFLELTAKYSDLHLFVRGGHAVPFYNVLENENILRTQDLEKTPVSFAFNPDSNGIAVGHVIYDDSDSDPYKAVARKLYLHVRVTFDARNNEIAFDVLNGNEDYNKMDVYVRDLVIYNQSEPDEESKLRFLTEESAKTDNMNFYYKDNNLYVKFLKPVDIRKIGKIAF